MEIKTSLNPTQGAHDHASLADLILTLKENCENCTPLTPITCVTACKTWKLKNQLRKLHEKTENPNFMTKLLNTLKNKRRLQLLETIRKEHYSITRLQQELKKQGFSHSQQTITQEYVNPLLEVGLLEEDHNLYYATVFGGKLTDLVKDSHDFGDTLPPHSECYEEITLDMLLRGPKTYGELGSIIPAKSAARVLSRLQKSALAETNKEKDYIFFFTTKRSTNGSNLSCTERRVYENILAEGICARKLAENTGISLRRTYKYLRKLKGKKLVFTRKKPTTYTLTAKGNQTALMLEAVHKLAVEASKTAAIFVKGEKTIDELTMETSPKTKKKKEEQIVPLTAIRPVEPNQTPRVTPTQHSGI
jgi:DNA-binding transcriptional regulator YhcF (GntR family)